MVMMDVHGQVLQIYLLLNEKLSAKGYLQMYVTMFNVIPDSDSDTHFSQPGSAKGHLQRLQLNHLHQQ